MTMFWMSWYQPGDDVRPVKCPPPEGILGWWHTGNGNEGETLCAMVTAEDEDGAWSLIRSLGAWPDAGRERFCERATTPNPSDRFPLSAWMKPRFEAAKEKA